MAGFNIEARYRNFYTGSFVWSESKPAVTAHRVHFRM